MRTTNFLSVLAAASIGFCSLTADAHAAPRIRKNIKDLTADDQQRFVDAMFALQNPASFPGPGTGGAWPADQKEPQNRYEQYVRAHDTNGDLFHHIAGARSNPIFLPWHRQLLFQMENDVRSLGQKMVKDTSATSGQREQDFSNFTLPYWDGTRDAYPTAALGGNGDLTGGTPTYEVTSGPFAPTETRFGAWKIYTSGTETRGKLKRDFRPQNPAPTNPSDPPQGSFTRLTTEGPASWADLLTKNKYRDLLCKDGLSGLEAAPGLHDDHHFQVGGPNGQLGNPQSGTTDPTFWLLHAYTDLQWAVWESTNGVRYDDLGQAKWGLETPMPGGLTELNAKNIYDHDPIRTGVPKGSVEPVDVLNIFTMPLGGYTYDYRPNPRLNPDGTLNPKGDDRVVLGAPVPEPATFAILVPSLCASLIRNRRSVYT